MYLIPISNLSTMLHSLFYERPHLQGTHVPQHNISNPLVISFHMSIRAPLPGNKRKEYEWDKHFYNCVKSEKLFLAAMSLRHEQRQNTTVNQKHRLPNPLVLIFFIIIIKIGYYKQTNNTLQTGQNLVLKTRNKPCSSALQVSDYSIEKNNYLSFPKSYTF